MATYKKERIKDQMVNTAARIWGLQENEIESNFDPLIMLIIEACAAELEKIGQQITESNSRLLDYLAGILIPGSLFGAIPASGIIQAQPLDSKATITKQAVFYLSQKIQRVASNSTETLDLYLSPVGDFTILKAELSYIFSGNKLFKLTENNHRQTQFTTDNNHDSNEIWLAISPDKSLDSLDGLNLCFDMRSHSGAASLYASLAYANASLNGEPLIINHGYGAEAKLGINLQEIMLTGDDNSSKLNRKAGFLYENRFLHIQSGSAKKTGSQFPTQLEQILPADLVKDMKATNLVFLRIELPQYFPQEIFDSMAVSINAFPVVNRKLQTLNYRTDDWLNIIPLPVDGIFFDLANVKSERGDPYMIRPAAAVDNLVAGEAIVRTSGVGKTSSREVREMINHLAETIRDQSAYFGQLSNEFILDKLREIGKILANLEDSMQKANNKKAEFHYLMLRPKKNGEMISVDYWITQGNDANYIKAGLALNAGSQTAVNAKKCFTITGFTGGKNAVTESEKKSILRQQLHGAGKIISTADIKMQCMILFGDKLEKVEVTKSVQVSVNKAAGFTRSIDIHLTFSNKVTEPMKAEMENLCRELEYILLENASPVYPFRVLTNR